MGHGQKNTNRGNAIAGNTKRARDNREAIEKHRKETDKFRETNASQHLDLERRLRGEIMTVAAVLESLGADFRYSRRPWYRKANDWIQLRFGGPQILPKPSEPIDDQVDDVEQALSDDSPFYLGAIEATPEKKDPDSTLFPVVRVDLDDQVEPDPLDDLINEALAITEESVAIQVEAIAESADAAILALDSIIEPPTVGVPTLNEREEDSGQESASRSDPRDADRRATPDDALSGDYRIEANAETIAESVRSNYNANLYDPKKILARLELRLEAARGEVADLFDNQELDRDEKTKLLNDGMEQIEEFEQRIGHQRLIIAGLVPDPNERRRREANG